MVGNAGQYTFGGDRLFLPLPEAYSNLTADGRLLLANAVDYMTTVPEPSVGMLAAFGGACCILRRRRQTA